MKSFSFCVLTVACLAGVGCTRPNPAFQSASREPSTDRQKEGARDAAPPSEPAADANALPDASASGVADVMVTDMTLPADAGADLPGEEATARADAPVDASPPDSTLAVGMVVRYPLDLVGSSVVADATGTRNGAMHGGAGWTDVGFPGARFANGGALVLDGTSGYVTLPTAGLPTVAGVKSVSLWFWQAAPSNGLRKTLLAVTNPDESTGVQIGLQRGVPSVWFWRQLIGTAMVAAPQSSPAGWTHLVFVQQGAAQRLYVNGALADSASVIILRSSAVTSFMLGGYAVDDGEDERWSGRIDDVRVYDRALTASEIAALAAGMP